MAEAKSKALFSDREKKELDYLKSKEFLDSNFINAIKYQSRKRLNLFIANASKAQKEFMKKELEADIWKEIDKQDHKLMMDKLLDKETNSIKEKRKIR